MAVSINFRVDEVDWQKSDGLVPAIVQDALSLKVLMLGYMSRESFDASLQCGEVTFYSRSRQKLWRKGETSGHTLVIESVALDCDQDTILIQATPRGPTCHLGTESCFNQSVKEGTKVSSSTDFLRQLWHIIEERAEAGDSSSSYTAKLLASGIQRQAQKVGEEGVEVALAAVAQNDQALLGEAADLVYHLLVLLKGRGLSLDAVVQVLAERHQK